MTRLFGYLLLFALTLVACATPSATPTPRSLGGAAEVAPSAPTATPAPQLQLTAERGQPGQELAVVGTAFPPGAAVEIALTTATEPRQIALTTLADIDERGDFAAVFTLPTVWPGGDTAETVELLVRATSLTLPSQTAEAPLLLDYSEAFRRYENEAHGFSIELPVDWVVEGPLLTPLGTMYLVGRAPIVPGDPAVSTFLVARSDKWLAHRAAEQLLCGGGCVSDVRFTLTTVNEMPARELRIETEGTPPLTWYFVERDGVLLYFSLHDPVTFATLERLVQTLRFEPATAVAVADVVPTAEPVIIATVEPIEVVAEEEEQEEEPTAEAPPSPTPAATPDLREVGPVQIVINLMTGLLRQDLFSVAEVEYLFTRDYLAENDPRPLLLNALQVGQLLKSFNATRAEGANGVVVRVDLVLLDETRTARLLTMVKEDEVWRINSIEEVAPSTPTPVTPEATPEATPEPEEG